MRRAALSALLIAGALLVQLTAVNRLPLPGGGVPDLVLLVVIALALEGGPQTGALAGFCAGLSLDLAPPAGQLIGEYALVFCVVGYLCGKLRGALGRSALLPFAVAAAAAAAGEALYAGLGLVLAPAQVTWATMRQVLPSSVLYDIVLSPPALFAVILASRWASDRAGGLAGVAHRPASRRRSGAARQAGGGRVPRLRAAGARQGDGWLGGRPASWRAPSWRLRRPAPPPRLRPGAGLAGSAARRQPTGALSARTSEGIQAGPRRRPVNLRLAAGRGGRKFRGRAADARGGRGALPRIAFSGRGGGSASWPAGTGRGAVRPGAGRPARSPGFRPAAGLRGGSSSAGHPREPPAGQPASLRLQAGRRRGKVIGGGMLTGRGLSGRRPAVPSDFRTGRSAGFRPGRRVGLRPGRSVGFRPGRSVGPGPGRAVGSGAGRLGSGRKVSLRPGRAVRFGSGRRSALTRWVLGRFGRRSAAGRIGSRRTGGSR